MKTENVNVVFPEGKERVELVILEGKPLEQLPIKAPIKTDLSGTLGAPVEFLSRRFEHSKFANTSIADDIFNHFDHTRCHVIVDREKVSITLTIDEHDEYKRGVVVGTLEIHPKFKEFGINSGRIWDPNELGQFMKMNRAFFADREKNMVLVSQLKNFEAKVDTLIERQKEDGGSFKDNYSGVVSSNLPDTFSLSIPVFKGYKKEHIDVEFYATVSGRDISLQLIAPSAVELFETIRDEVIDNEIVKIREIAPNMVIIEK